MTIGEKIKKIRKDRDLSQAKFSEMIGVHLNHLGRCESGESIPSAEIIQTICQVFNISADYLLLDEGNEDAPHAKIADKELLEQFEYVQKMDAEDIKVIKNVIKTYMLKYKFKKLSETK